MIREKGRFFLVKLEQCTPARAVRLQPLADCRARREWLLPIIIPQQSDLPPKPK
jgi:hypothetical protein